MVPRAPAQRAVRTPRPAAPALRGAHHSPRPALRARRAASGRGSRPRVARAGLRAASRRGRKPSPGACAAPRLSPRRAGWSRRPCARAEPCRQRSGRLTGAGSTRAEAARVYRVGRRARGSRRAPLGPPLAPLPRPAPRRPAPETLRPALPPRGGRKREGERRPRVTYGRRAHLARAAAGRGRRGRARARRRRSRRGSCSTSLFFPRETFQADRGNCAPRGSRSGAPAAGSRLVPHAGQRRAEGALFLRPGSGQSCTFEKRTSRKS